MAYKVIILYRLYMPSYFLGTFAEYPEISIESIKNESTVQGVSVFVSPCAVPFRNVLCAVLFILLVEFHYGFYSFSENIK